MNAETTVKVRRLGALVLGAATLLAAAGVARAEVKREGDWSADPEVSLDVDGVSRAEAISRLADAAHWALLLEGRPRGTVSVHMKNQHASKVLDALLADGAYSAKRDGAMVAIKPLAAAGGEADEAAPPAAPSLPALPPIPKLPPLPPLPPIPKPPAIGAPRVAITLDDDDEDAAEEAEEQAAEGKATEDRVVTGHDVRVEAGETVHDVVAMGGSVDIFGTATGDVSAMGGSVHIHEGAHVFGDVNALGGGLTIDDGARVDGDTNALGGGSHIGSRAEIHGDVRTGRHHHRHHHGRSVDLGPSDEAPEHRSLLQRATSEAGSSITHAALLFAFGAVLISLATRRLEALKVQIATRPMRSFATGVVALIAAAVILVALCVTLVGIPFAFFAVLASFVAACAGLCAVLETTGSALLGHRTPNPYVHLAFGCALFMVLGAIPFVGNLLVGAALLIGIGSVVATRGAGLVPPRNGSAGSPYRDPPTV